MYITVQVLDLFEEPFNLFGKPLFIMRKIFAFLFHAGIITVIPQLCLHMIYRTAGDSVFLCYLLHRGFSTNLG